MTDSIFTMSIWDRVRKHPWKYRARTRSVNAILWHTTRGNQGYTGSIEFSASINWFLSQGNMQGGNLSLGIAPYAGISHVAIGPEHICEVVNIDTNIPAWSSWPSDEHAISVEVAQSNLGQLIEIETIRNCQRFAAWCHDKYGISLARAMPVLDDWSWTGQTGHENTVQGRAQGKSDPGIAFWTPYMEDDSMSAESEALLLKIATVLAGPATGRDFQNVQEALDAFSPLANNDIITLLGLGGVQQLAGELRQALDEHKAMPHTGAMYGASSQDWANLSGQLSLLLSGVRNLERIARDKETQGG